MCGYVSFSLRLYVCLSISFPQESVDATSHGLLNDDVEALYDLTVRGATFLYSRPPAGRRHIKCLFV